MHKSYTKRWYICENQLKYDITQFYVAMVPFLVG